MQNHAFIPERNRAEPSTVATGSTTLLKRKHNTNYMKSENVENRLSWSSSTPVTAVLEEHN